MNNEDIGKLILRLALGGMMLVHGFDKLKHGIAFIRAEVAAAGMPELLAAGIYVGELVAPLMVIIGWNARIGAILITISMLFAIGLVHTADVFSLGPNGGWALDAQGMFLFSAVALALIGPGRYRIDAWSLDHGRR